MARLSFLFLFLFLIFFLPFSLRVKEVSCFADNSNNCPSESVLQFEALRGLPYFDFKGKVDRILKQDNLVDSYDFYFVFPSRFVINLVLQKPNFFLKDKKSGFFYMVDSGGKILAKKESLLDVSFVETDDYELRVGEILSDSVLTPLWVFYYLDSLYTINYARLFADRFEVKLLAGPLLIFPVGGKGVEYLVGAARYLVSQLREEYDKFKFNKSYDNITIDLRYGNPILR